MKILLSGLTGSLPGSIIAYFLFPCLLWAQPESVADSFFLPSKPSLITNAPGGNFYLIDAVSMEIVLSDNNGNEIKRASGFGTAPGSLVDPVSIVFRGMQLFVLDRGTVSIKIYDRFLNFRSEVSLKNQLKDIKFYSPSSLSIDPFGNYWICDLKGNSITCLDRNFQLLRRIDETDNLGQPLLSPENIYSDENNLLVLTAGEIHLFDHFLNQIFTVKRDENTLYALSNGRVYLIKNGKLLYLNTDALNGQVYEVIDIGGENPDSFLIFRESLFLFSGKVVSVFPIN